MRFDAYKMSLTDSQACAAPFNFLVLTNMLTTMDKSCTDGVSSPDLLTGTTVRLWPYVPGVYGRDALYRVWRLMEDDGATKQAFWDEAYLETGGDLASFVQAFSATNKLLLMIERRDTKALCGAFWVTQMVPGHQAFVGMWMQKGSRGRYSKEAARLALTYTFSTGQFRQLWALTPWSSAYALCLRMGFMPTALLDEFCHWQNDYKNVWVLRLTKEAFDVSLS